MAWRDDAMPDYAGNVHRTSDGREWQLLGWAPAPTNILPLVVPAESYLWMVLGGRPWVWTKDGQGRDGNPAPNQASIIAAFGAHDEFYATTTSGLYRVDGMATTWEPLAAGFTGRVGYVRGEAMLALPGDGAPGILRSVDGGATWDHQALAVPGDPSEVVKRLGELESGAVAFTAAGVWTADSNAASWTLERSGTSISGVVHDGAIHVQDDAELLRKDGTTWSPIGPALHADAVMHSTGAQLMAYLPGEGLFLFDPVASTWISTGFHEMMTRSLLADQQRAAVFGGVFQHEWTFGNSGWARRETLGLVSATHAGTQRWLAAAGRNVFASSDAGASWAKLGDELDARPVAIAEHDARVLVGVNSYFDDPFAAPPGPANGGGLYALDGDTWSPVHAGLPPRKGGSEPSAIDAILSHAGTLYVFVRDHGVYASIDGGNSWMPMTQGIEYPEFTADSELPTRGAMLGANGSQLFLVHWTDIGWLERSALRWDPATDAWQPITLPGGPYRQVTALATGDDRVYLGTELGEVFGSDDGGVSWVGNSLGSFRVRALQIAGRRLLAGGREGVWYLQAAP